MLKNTPFCGRVAAIPTPFEGDGAIDWFALDRLIDRAITLGYPAVALATRFGEGDSLSLSEKLHIFEESALVTEHRTALILTVQSPSEAEEILSLGRDISAAAVLFESAFEGRGIYSFAEKCARFGLPMAFARPSGRGSLKAFPELFALQEMHALAEYGKNFLETVELCNMVEKRVKGEVFSLDERLFPAMEPLGAIGTLSRSALFISARKQPPFALSARLAAPDGIAYAKELLREQGVCGQTVRLPL